MTGDTKKTIKDRAISVTVGVFIGVLISVATAAFAVGQYKNKNDLEHEFLFNEVDTCKENRKETEKRMRAVEDAVLYLRTIAEEVKRDRGD